MTLSIPKGHIVGLIGRNGSGKTTLLRHVAGLYLPSEGTCRTFGTPVAELGESELSRIGLVQQEERFLHWMTVREHLDHVIAVGGFHDTGDLAGLHRKKRLVEGLRHRRDRRAGRGW